MVLNTLGYGDVIEKMLDIKVYKMGGYEVLFTFKAWRHAIDNNEPIYTELCHEIYSTYEFEEYVLDEELTNDYHINANEYWLSISSYDKVHRNELWLMNMFGAKNREGYANVAWLIKKLMKRKGVGTQKESMICYGQFMTKLAKRIRVLTEEVLNGLSALTYYRTLDATTLRELIGSDGRLILEDPVTGVQRVAMPRPSPPTINDFYDRMGRMEIL
nr:hypothetical protein [Tanacetum cinerariifolium]